MKSIADVIKELEQLKERAELRSRMIIENGRTISDVERAKSQGHVDAYSFCIVF